MLPQSQPADFDLGTLRPRFLACGRREVIPEAFDRLLEWLAMDREEAGRVYEKIRRIRSARSGARSASRSSMGLK